MLSFFYDIIAKIVQQIKIQKQNILLFCCIKYVMEKLVVSKKENSSTEKNASEINSDIEKNRSKKHGKLFSKRKSNCIKTDPEKQIKKDKNFCKSEVGKNQKNKRFFQKKLKNYVFFGKIKENLRDFLIFNTIFVLAIVFVFLTFLHNQHYDFLNRPKIISGSMVVLLLMVFACLICFVLFLFDNFKQEKNCEKERQKLDSENEDDSKNIKKSRFKFFKKIRMKKNYFCHIFLTTQIFICIAFLLKIQWLCVLFSFANFVLCIQNFACFKGKKFAEKATFTILLLVSICVLSTFYMLFMLN